MDFDPTDEQRMLAETVNSLLDKRYDPSSRLALLDSELGWSRDLWAQYAQLGLLGLTFDEQYDGVVPTSIEEIFSPPEMMMSFDRSFTST